MSLLTRCAHCQTVFRITLEQLQAHGGQVRCGRCMQVFNGVAALEPETAKPAATESAVSAAPVTIATATPASAQPDAEEPTPPATDGATLQEATAEIQPATGEAESSGEIAAETSTELPESLPETAETQLPSNHDPADAATADPANPFIHDIQELEAAPVGVRRPWLAAASAVLAIGLIAQAIFFYRGDIAARHPLARQWLTAACAQLGCTLLLPQAPKALLIEASDLQLLDPARPDRIQLTATLRNHAGHDVAYPALDLVLTNANDHTLARRIFLPAEYLGGRDAGTGIAANAELTVRLVLETGDLVAAGFRLAVLAAPCWKSVLTNIKQLIILNILYFRSRHGHP